jgi:hypothetical protein
LPDLLFHLDAAGLRFRELLVDILPALDRDIEDLQFRSPTCSFARAMWDSSSPSWPVRSASLLCSASSLDLRS